MDIRERDVLQQEQVRTISHIVLLSIVWYCMVLYWLAPADVSDIYIDDVVSAISSVHSLSQLSALKEEIRRLERNNLRGSANLEYLKNVLVIFLENTATRDKYAHMHCCNYYNYRAYLQYHHIH